MSDGQSWANEQVSSTADEPHDWCANAQCRQCNERHTAGIGPQRATPSSPAKIEAERKQVELVMALEEMRDMSRAAAERVAQQPTWQRNLLTESSKANHETPRTADRELAKQMERMQSTHSPYAGAPDDARLDLADDFLPIASRKKIIEAAEWHRLKMIEARYASMLYAAQRFSGPDKNEESHRVALAILKAAGER